MAIENKRIDFLRKKANSLTLMPGVYLMKDTTGKVIYVGKAKALKNRVTSYFRENSAHNEKVRQMVLHVHDFDYIVTDSEFEALVLECSLIKQYNPKYNILLKDGKGYHYIKISDGDFPRLTAEKQKTEDGKYIGPYISSFVVKQAVDEANRVYRRPDLPAESSRRSSERDGPVSIIILSSAWALPRKNQQRRICGDFCRCSGFD